MTGLNDQIGSQHFLTNKHIVISGAGIAGLSFAISLHKLWPSVSVSPPPRITIYERDPCPVPKDREGYSLSLRSDSPSGGIQTLQKMGILDKIINVSVAAAGSEVARDKEGAFCVWNVDDGKWKTVMKVVANMPKGCPVSGLRIARAELRTALVEFVEELGRVEIKWDEAITGICPLPPSSENGRANPHFQVELSSSEKDSGDILLAADGSSSKLRTLLRPSDTTKFAGPTCISGIAPIKGCHPSSNLNEFGSVISGTGYGLFIAPIDQDTMLWSLSYIVDSPPPPKKQPLSDEENKALLNEAREKAEDIYGKQFSAILDATDVHRMAQFNAMDKAPFLHTAGYIHTPELTNLGGKVIFLGDANHAVSPFAGNGANLALMDSWDIAEALAQSTSLEDAITRYDGMAVGRAKRVIRMSHFSINVMHATGWWLWFYMTLLKVVRFVFFTGRD